MWAPKAFIFKPFEGIFPPGPHAALLSLVLALGQLPILPEINKKRFWYNLCQILVQSMRSDRSMNTEFWEQEESHLITWTGWMLGRRQGVTPGQVLQDLWKIKKAEEEHCKEEKS